MENIEMNGYKRISKAQAKKLFNDGDIVRVVPNKCRPENMWTTQDWEKANFHEIYGENQFERIVNSWKFYNGNHELGYYPAFYVKA